MALAEGARGTGRLPRPPRPPSPARQLAQQVATNTSTHPAVVGLGYRSHPLTRTEATPRTIDKQALTNLAQLWARGQRAGFFPGQVMPIPQFLPENESTDYEGAVYRSTSGAEPRQMVLPHSTTQTLSEWIPRSIVQRVNPSAKGAVRESGPFQEMQENTALHEWAHMFQKPGILANPVRGEGLADAFANRAIKKLRGRNLMGLVYPNRSTQFLGHPLVMNQFATPGSQPWRRDR